jgi:hypothetical protein
MTYQRSQLNEQIPNGIAPPSHPRPRPRPRPLRIRQINPGLTGDSE